MKKKIFGLAATLCLVALTLAVTLPLATSSAKEDSKRETFRRRSQLLVDNESAMTTDTNTKKANLDRKKLEKRKVATDDIVFMQEMANFSNDLVEMSKNGQAFDGAKAKLIQYPKVQEYFQEASKLSKKGETLSIKKSGQPHPLGIFAIVGTPWGEAAGMADCGIYWSPKPGSAKSWVTHKVNNADATLRSWGYRSTPGLAGGGWTRSQTWHPWNCGFNTFRDHALRIDSRTIREQNYHGWNPRGEPNPEVYASGPWPYSTWPAYVYWWHNTR